MKSVLWGSIGSLIALAWISCSNATENDHIAGHIRPFSGHIIGPKDSLEEIFQKYGLHGRISVQNNADCSAASGCSYSSLEVRHLSVPAQSDNWYTVPMDDFRFPWKASFWNDTTRASDRKSSVQQGFLDYPHFGEDYNQTAIFAREVSRRGSVLAVYVASREIGQVEPAPAPVDFVKFEFVATPAANNGAVQYHLLPVAMARSKRAYASALVALYCEIGVKSPELRETNPGFLRAVSCRSAPR